LAGERVRLPDEPGQPEVELAPAAPTPPLWIGNASPVAIRRAARWGDGWFPSLVPPSDLAEGGARLAERAVAANRPTPAITIGATGALGSGIGIPTRDEIAVRLSRAYGIPSERATALPITGKPREAAHRLAAYQTAGAHHLVMGLAGGDWRRQCELLTKARELLG
jgi:alkanesulfonate monooxygenase SsuD/methylene tetrahydromethanopterin reductase-like flavin-dependent oxidoreductase (luciferase family)